MTTTPDWHALEQTIALGNANGLPMTRLVQQTRKALGLSKFDEGPEEPLPRDLVNYDLEELVEEEECEVYGFPFNDPSDRPKIAPGPTSSDLLTGENKKCASINRHGQPCGAYRRPGSQLCPFHDPNLTDQMRDSRAEGGKRTTYRLPQQVETNLAQLQLGLHSRAGVQASIEAVTRMLLLGRIPPRHAAVLMRFFNGAIRNLRDTNGFNDHQLARYTDVLEDVLRTSGLIERDLEDQARKLRVDQISDVGAKREEVLQANETFGYLPPSKTTTTPPRSPQIGHGPNDVRPFHG